MSDDAALIVTMTSGYYFDALVGTKFVIRKNLENLFCP